MSGFIDKFRPFIQKVVPTVYDDSLSYYELISKVVGYLNQVIDHHNELVEEIDDIHKVALSEVRQVRDEFKTVQLWLENEAMPHNIEEKLQTWFDSGKLAQIINDDVFSMKANLSDFEQVLADFEATKTEVNATVDGAIADLQTQFNTLETSNTTQLDTFNTTIDTRLAEMDTTIDIGLNDKPSYMFVHERSNIPYRKTKFVGHRGFNYAFPENTQYSFMATATNRGAFWGCHTDLQATSDGYWVCMHDTTIDRTTTGTGIVKDMTLSQIKQYKPRDRGLFTGTGIGGQTFIPSFTEYLEILSTIDVTPVIEIHSTGDLQSLVNSLQSYGYLHQCIVMARSQNILSDLRSISDDLKLMYKTEIFDVNAINFAKSLGNCGLEVKSDQLSRDTIHQCHLNNIEVGFYVVNDPYDIQRAIKYGADYVTSDRGVGKIVNNFKRFTLNQDASGKIQLTQNASSEECTLEWIDLSSSVKLTYEFPFQNMPGNLNGGSFVSMHSVSEAKGYEFATKDETAGSLVFKVLKDNVAINPLVSLPDPIYINILVFSW